MQRNYQTLDAIVVIGAMLIVGGTVAALVWNDIPQNNLPIIASLAGTLLGTIVGGYAGYRWGSSEREQHAGTTATEALAQLAGAGPPPPAEPMKADTLNAGDDVVNVEKQP